MGAYSALAGATATAIWVFVAVAQPGALAESASATGGTFVCRENADEVQVIAQWRQLSEDVWVLPPPSHRPLWLQEHPLNPEVAVVTGVKWWNGEYYVSVPRWFGGVPATLNKLVRREGAGTHEEATRSWEEWHAACNGEQADDVQRTVSCEAEAEPPAPADGWLLEPYPSLDWNAVGNGTALQYVQSMEIDLLNRMWILDVGRRNIFMADEAVDGSPKLVIWDMSSNTMERTFVFPDYVASWEGSFLNDIVLDVTRGYAYMTNTWGEGGIVVYDYNSNEARLFTDPVTMAAEQQPLTIQGFTYPIFNPTDSIALSPKGEQLYYAPLDGFNLHQVDTDLLRNFSTTNEELAAAVDTVGSKEDASDGFTMDGYGRLYFGGLEHNRLNSWDTTTGTIDGGHKMAGSAELLNWVDTFAWDDQGHVIFSSNRLQHLFFHPPVHPEDPGYNFTDVNFRIMRMCVNRSSYQVSISTVQLDQGDDSVPKWVAILLSALLLVTVFALAFAVVYARRSAATLKEMRRSIATGGYSLLDQ